jgi:hypothetical protein
MKSPPFGGWGGKTKQRKQKIHKIDLWIKQFWHQILIFQDKKVFTKGK